MALDIGYTNRRVTSYLIVDWLSALHKRLAGDLGVVDWKNKINPYLHFGETEPIFFLCVNMLLMLKVMLQRQIN